MSDETVQIGVGLADAIGNLRAELERAIDVGQGSNVGFAPGPLELEFQVGIPNYQRHGRKGSGVGGRARRKR